MVTLKSIVVNIKMSPRWIAPSVPSYVFPWTSSSRREASTKTEIKTWDPGGSKIIQVNSHLILLISTIEISKLSNAEDSDNYATLDTQGLDSRADIDSHTNIPVVGQNCYILSDSGIFSEVNALSPENKTKKISIVEA